MEGHDQGCQFSLHDFAEICASSLKRTESVSCDHLAAADKVLSSLSATRLSTMGSSTLCHALDATSLLISSAAFCNGPAAEALHLTHTALQRCLTTTSALMLKSPSRRGPLQSRYTRYGRSTKATWPVLTGGDMRVYAKQAGYLV